MAVELRDKTILVTGASRGIGTHIARELARRGASLILTARDAASLAEVARACETDGGRVRVIACDLTNPDDRARLLDEAGELDVLINNAGVEHTKALLDQSDGEVAAQLELNLAVPIDLVRRVLPHMLARKSGVVVNVASMSGKGATPYNSVYAATKYGLVGWTASLRLELADTGVHVGVVCPGFVSDGMWGRTGLRAPAVMREVSPQQVVRGVLKAINGAGEVLVTAGPIRPLLALRELFPGLEAPLMRATGIVGVLSARAELSAQSTASSGDDMSNPHADS